MERERKGEAGVLPFPRALARGCWFCFVRRGLIVDPTRWLRSGAVSNQTVLDGSDFLADELCSADILLDIPRWAVPVTER